MVKLILWSLAVCGLTNILVYGTILDKPRLFIQNKLPKIGSVFDCVMCTGTWVGLLMWYPISISAGVVDRWYFSIPIDMMCASAVAVLYDRVIAKLQN